MGHHSKLHNVDDQTEVCIKCKNSFQSHKVKVVTLSGAQGPFICWYCNLGLQEKRQLEIHMKIEHGHLVYGQSEWYGCRICYNALYSRRQDISKHMRSAHNRETVDTENYLVKRIEDVEYPCSICGVKNLFAMFCKDHMSVVKKECYSCSMCHEKYPNKNILDAHVNIEHGKDVFDDPMFACYQCHQCNMQLYLGREHFLRHMIEVHDDQSEENLDSYAVNHLADILSICNVCKSQCLFSMFCSKHDADISIRYCDKHDQQHVCTLCDAAFVNCQTLWKHKFSVHSDERLGCNLSHDCSQVFVDSPRALMEHWLQWHWTSEQIEEELKISSKTVNGVVQFFCPFCNLSVHEFILLKRHLNQIHLTASSCSYCGRKYKSKQQLKDHLSSMHSDVSDLKEDEEITLSFHNPISQLTDLNKESYKISEGNLVKFKCSDCAKAYTRFTDLKRHLITHTGERNMSCTLCDKAYYNLSSLTEHYKRTHHMKVTNEVQNLKKQTEISIDGVTKYKCPLCPSITTRFDSLQLHMRIHSGEKPFSCEVCGKSFYVREHLKRHFNNIHMKVGYQCNVCGRILTDSSNLKVHMRNHTGEKKYVCEVCGKGFTQWASHYYHKFTHSKERSFQCSFCEMAFRCPRTLAEHKKTHVHSGAKHTCDTCGNEFNSRKNLTSHMRIHVAGRPHQCNVCNAKFKLRKYLLQHLKTHKRSLNGEGNENS